MKKAILVLIVVMLLAAVAIAMLAAVACGASFNGQRERRPTRLSGTTAGWPENPFHQRSIRNPERLHGQKRRQEFPHTTLLHLHPGHPLETLVEVSCPDRERFTTTIGDRAFHAVRIGSKAYVEQQNGSWSVQDTPPLGWSPCGDNPGEPAPWAVMSEGLRSRYGTG